MAEGSDRKQSAVVSVRFTDEELEKLRATASRTGEPLSSLIRRASLEPDLYVVLTGHPSSTNAAVAASFGSAATIASYSDAGVSVTRPALSESSKVIQA